MPNPRALYQLPYVRGVAERSVAVVMSRLR